MIETSSGTSKYPWVTIWGIGMTYVGHSMAKAPKSPKCSDMGGISHSPCENHSEVPFLINHTSFLRNHTRNIEKEKRYTSLCECTTL